VSGAASVAFGLALAGELPAGVRFHASARPPARRVRLTRMAAPAAAAPLDATAGVAIVPQPDGGHRISAPGCGTCLVVADGSAVAYATGASGGPWRRLLVDQALPFAACAAGLECLHASAVVLDGRLLALTGASGAGKSSLALALLRRGALPFADDVLALEAGADGGLLGHPALPRLRVRRAEAERVGTAALAALSRVACREEDALELALPSRASVAPLPLGALYVIERRPDAPRLAFLEVEDPRLVLACSFNFVLATPMRLARLLELCHLLADRVHLRRVLVPPWTDADALAAAIAADAARAPADVALAAAR
jgi:hypothetical protein